MASFTLTTTSTSSFWSPSSVKNPGDTLSWDAGMFGVIGVIDSDTPTFDFSSNFGTVTIVVTSANNLVGLTDLGIDNLDITSVDVSSIPNLASLDVSNNSLTSGELDDIVDTLNSNGLSDGLLLIANNAGVLSPSGIINLNNLIAKSWVTDLIDPNLSCSASGQNSINLTWQTQIGYDYYLYVVPTPSPSDSNNINTAPPGNINGDGTIKSYNHTGLNPNQSYQYFMVITFTDELPQTDPQLTTSVISCVTVCILPGATVETENGSKLIENIVSGDVVINEFGELVEIINNIKFGFDRKMVVSFESNCFGNNLPNDKLSITYGHPIKIPNNNKTFSEEEYPVQDLVNRNGIQMKSTEVINTYTLMTKSRDFVMINGIPVCTWSIEDFAECCENYRKRNKIVLHELI
jgi:hypothetical protein